MINFPDLRPSAAYRLRNKQFLSLAPYVVVEWLTLLLCIRDVPGSNLESETGYPDQGSFVVFLSSSKRIPDSPVKLGHDRFLPNPFQFIVHLSPYYSTLYRLVLDAEKRRKTNYKPTLATVCTYGPSIITNFPAVPHLKIVPNATCYRLHNRT
jgi:hypothetical protein